MLIINTSTEQTYNEKQFRQLHPYASFPKIIIDSHISDFGYAVVTDDAEPNTNWDQVASLGLPKVRNDVWVREWTINDRPNSGLNYLNGLKDKAYNRIDTEAGDARDAWNSSGGLILAEYQDKWEQAKDYIADNTLTIDDVPMIFENVGTTDGTTALDVANTYISRGIAWRNKNAKIAKKRRRAKDLVSNATTPDEITTILQSINW